MAIVSLLIKSGASVNAATDRGSTPLHEACESGRIDTSVVSLLVESGAPLEAATLYGVTPLFMACMVGKSKIASFLVRSGASLNALTFDGYSPLKIACEGGHGEVVLEIMKYASETQIRDSFRALLENARKWFDEKKRKWGAKPLSSFLTEDVMDDLEYKLANNRENNIKGAR